MPDPSIYTVGWICALTAELVAAKAFFDKEHGKVEEQDPNDNNTYALGEMGQHNVAVASLPKSEYGIGPAATVARDMVRTFPNIRIGLMVGIGGGAPSTKHDIRLGDIVVSAPSEARGGVLQYDYGKTVQERQFQLTGSLNQPPSILLTAVSSLEADYQLKGHKLNENVEEVLKRWPRLRKQYSRPSTDTDRLYRAEFVHQASSDPKGCDAKCYSDPDNVITREPREEDEDDPAVHYGLIASASQMMRDATIRDQLANDKGVLCFEMEAAGLMNHFPCLVVRGICDYADSHKNKQWQGFAAMVAVAYAKDVLQWISPSEVKTQAPLAKKMEEIESKVEGIAADVKDTNDTVTTIQAESRHSEIERWLKPPKFSTNVNKAKARRHEGSGQWFIDSSVFQDFKAGSRRHLWLHGLAGCGKTVLSTRILDELRQIPEAVVIAHYFDFNDVAKQSVDGLLCSLVFQLYHHGWDTALELDHLFYSCARGSQRPSQTELEKCFSSMLQGRERIFILIDALDECTSRGALLLWISQFIKGNVQLLLTARPEDYIQAQLTQLIGPENCLSLDKDSVDPDIKSYVLFVLENDMTFKSKGLSKHLKEEILEKVGMGAAGMFRWAACQMDSLAACLSPSAVHQCLKNLPRDLNETYDRMLDHIHPDYKNDSIRLLQFLVHTMYPITLAEAVEVIATRIEPGQNRLRFNPDNRPFSHQSITCYCPGMISVVKVIHYQEWREEIHLTHFSVKEYLLQKDNFSMHRSASTIAQTFLAYLMDIYGPHYRMPLDFPLANYAASHWTTFAIVAGSDKTSVTMSVNFLSDAEMLSRWYRICKKPPLYSNRDWIRSYTLLPLSPTGSALEHSCQAGLTETARLLIQETKSKIQAKEIQSLLHIVIRNKTFMKRRCERVYKHYNVETFDALFDHYVGEAFDELFKLLLENITHWSGVRVNTTGLLFSASQEGHLEIVKQLLRAGADVNPYKWGNYNPLRWPLQYGHFQVAKLFIEWGAVDEHCWHELLEAAAEFNDLTTASGLLSRKPPSCSTYKALCKSCQFGHHSMFHLLVSEGTGFEYGGDSQSCIQIASQSGYDQIVRAILNSGFDITHGRIAKHSLFEALQNGHQRVIRTLLDAIGDHACVDPLVKNILKAASESKNEQIVRKICSQSQQESLIMSDTTCLDALYGMLLGEHRHILQLLVNQGARLFVRGGVEFSTPLDIAAYNGNAAVVKQFIDAGADINADGRVLHGAVSEGHEHIVQLLLDYGVNANLNYHSGTQPKLSSEPFLAALKLGKGRIAQMLLSYGAHSDGVDSEGNTALHLASEKTGHKTVQQLLELGANLHALNLSGQSPLHISSKDVVKMLLNAGANIEAKSLDGSTPLHVACRYPNVRKLRALIHFGADIHAQTDEGSNALELSLQSSEHFGYQVSQIVECLFENGFNPSKVDLTPSRLLDMACSESRSVTAAVLLKKAVEFNLQDNTLLHKVTSAVNLVAAMDVVTLLIERGADVNARDKDGCTALHFAAGCHSRESRPDLLPPHVAELLLDHGADINAKDNKGETALFKMFQVLGDSDIVKLLIERGADVNIQNNEGDTVLHEGKNSNFGLFKMLLDYGAQVNVLNKKGNSPLASILMNRDRYTCAVAELLAERGGKDIRDGRLNRERKFSATKEDEEDEVDKDYED